MTNKSKSIVHFFSDRPISTYKPCNLRNFSQPTWPILSHLSSFAFRYFVKISGEKHYYLVVDFCLPRIFVVLALFLSSSKLMVYCNAVAIRTGTVRRVWFDIRTAVGIFLAIVGEIFVFFDFYNLTLVKQQ